MISGKLRTLGQMAKESGVSRSYVKRVVRCISLSPKLKQAFLTGNDSGVPLKVLLQQIPLDWQQQGGEA